MSSRQTSLFSEEALPDNLMPWEIAAEQTALLAEVTFNRPLLQTFHYRVPAGLEDVIGLGQRVKAPFGRGDQTLTGYCVGLTHEIPKGRSLKALLEVVDRLPLVDASQLALTKWIAERYLCGWGQVLESVIPAGVKTQAGTRELLMFSLHPDYRDSWSTLRLPAKQKQVVQVAAEAGRSLRVDELSERADCGVSPIHSLREKGILVAEKERSFTVPLAADPLEPKVELRLNTAQLRAVETILRSIRAREHTTFLLHGVTGSGKTEVYMRVIEEVVSYGRQAIVLVPEISLTPQTIRRFRSRFDKVAVLHSHLTDAERHAHWRQIASGDVPVVVGARSAVFAPTPHLGLIVIDEEHETSFKQDSTPRYHAREVARERARQEGVTLVLGTATPTLETWLRVHQKKDQLISMPERVARRPMPPVLIVDTRNDPFIRQGAAIGRALFQMMLEALKREGQIILFLNVRGFSPVLWCKGCGQGMKCPDCDLTLTWHKQRGVALCHSCDYEVPRYESCPHCQKPGLINLGIGTERLEHEVQTRFPGVACLRMDSDTMKGRGSHDTALEAFRHGQAKILLGTQMIAKGLDFPNVTLVGVIDADTLLHQPDLRAAERTFQLIAQVAGRTGRGDRGGKVLVQTACPEQPAIVAAARHDYLGFAKAELQHRHVLKAPPFGHIIRLVARGPEEAEVSAWIQQVAERLREPAKNQQIQVKGPAPCQVTRLKSFFRYHLQLVASDLQALLTAWKTFAQDLPPTGRVEYIVDVDPLNLR